jgi:hypothetical protein
MARACSVQLVAHERNATPGLAVLRPYRTVSLPKFYRRDPRNKLLIREYNDSDLDALRRMHARQGFGYAFPDIADPIFVSKLVVEDDAGRAVMASLARLTCAMYMLADPAEGKPRERYARLLALHGTGERDLLARGLDDAHAWLPPPVAKRFGRRLTALGWVRDDTWTPYCHRLRP